MYRERERYGASASGDLGQEVGEHAEGGGRDLRPLIVGGGTKFREPLCNKKKQHK